MQKVDFSLVDLPTEAPDSAENAGGLSVLIGLDPDRVEAVIEAAKYEFQDVSTRMDEIVRDAEAHEITDQASYENAIEKAGAIKKLMKKIESRRKDVIAGADRFVRGINAFTKTFKDRGDKAERVYKRKCSAYSAKIEAERRARDEERRRKEQELQDQINREAAEKGIAPVQVQAVEEKPETVVRTESGTTAHTRTVWTFRISDLDAIPREFLIPDTVRKHAQDPESLTPTEQGHVSWYFRKVREAIDAGVREIPGFSIYEDHTTVIRSS